MGECTECGSQEFQLVERFHIDNGELYNIAPERVFVLGVQFQMFREELLSNHEEFGTYIYTENVDRIMKMCWNHKRVVTNELVEANGWTKLLVGSK